MMEREILIVGVNHRTAPVEVRERINFSNGALDDALRQLLCLGPISEGVILSTCNRVEVVAATADGDNAVEVLTGFLATGEHVAREQLREHLSVYRGREAVRHLFRVAASLDSMVVGEPQILGQLKDFYSRAATQTVCGWEGSIATEPIESEGCLSKTGLKVVPPSTDFHTPPLADPT